MTTEQAYAWASGNGPMHVLGPDGTLCGVTRWNAWQGRSLHGVELCKRCERRQRLGAKRSRPVDPGRAAAMAVMRSAGSTLQQIGTAFGLSRERARQILKSQP